MTVKPTAGVAAGAVFDRLAHTYDRTFTESLIGRAQRNAVWKQLLHTFHPDDNILELNCGTGEDAFFLASHRVSVFACDASQNMIARAEQRLAHMPAAAPVVFCHLPTERISELAPVQRFDGVFSNFSGLNCVADLAPVALALSSLVKPGGHLLLCLSTRLCLIEVLYYLFRRDTAKAFRRIRGRSETVIEGAPLTVFYPTIRSIRNALAPHFRLQSHTGIGVAIPPSYLEPWLRRHPGVLRLLCAVDPLLAVIPILRTTGDHILLRFDKVTS